MISCTPTGVLQPRLNDVAPSGLIFWMRRMKRYAIVIEKAASNYSAYVPDLPGCVATGATVEETESLLREAIELHLEGMRRWTPDSAANQCRGIRASAGVTGRSLGSLPNFANGGCNIGFLHSGLASLLPSSFQHVLKFRRRWLRDRFENNGIPLPDDDKLRTGL